MPDNEKTPQRGVFFMDLYGCRGKHFRRKSKALRQKRRLRENDGCETSVTLLRAKRIYTDHGNHGENRDYKQSELYRKLLG